MINSVSIIIIRSVNGLPLRREGVRLSRVTSEVISNNQSIKGAPPPTPLFLHWPTLAVVAPLTGQQPVGRIRLWKLPRSCKPHLLANASHLAYLHFNVPVRLEAGGGGGGGRGLSGVGVSDTHPRGEGVRGGRANTSDILSCNTIPSFYVLKPRPLMAPSQHLIGQRYLIKPAQRRV